MLLLLWIVPSAVLAQNLYGPSQLDQYARLLNSGNLGGFGFFQNALAEGTVRGLGDLNPPPLLPGLPPLPLTHEELLKQLTSTRPPETTRATAKPTTPSTAPGGVYAINSMVELPPMPENRLHGTFDDDGVFHPDHDDNANEVEETQIARNQIQGTRTRDFSETERDVVEAQTDDQNGKDVDYEDDDFYDDSSFRAKAKIADAHRLAQHDEKTRKPRQNPTTKRKHPQSTRQVKHFYDPPPKPHKRQILRQPVPKQERYPPFIFRPRPPPLQREPEYNNLLAEVEEYDDFLEQQRDYRSRYPKADVRNPYRDLPPGQLPASGFYSASNNLLQQELPPPRRIPTQGNVNWLDEQQQQQQRQQQQLQQQQQQQQQHQQQLQQQQQQMNSWLQPLLQSTAAPKFPESVTENPILNILKIFSIPHAHALAAPQLSLDDTVRTTTALSAPLPRANPYQFGMLPLPPHNIPLVDIQQQPLSFPQLGSPLVLQPLFSHNG